MRPLWLLCGILATIVCIGHAEYRTLDGTGNNVANPSWGGVSKGMRLIAPVSYTDGKDSPGTGPDIRVISNSIYTSLPNRVNSQGVSQLNVAFGQFLGHDLAWADNNGSTVQFPVPAGDAFYAQSVTFSTKRVTKVDGTGVSSPRVPQSATTAWLDASTVYGDSHARSAKLRTFTGGKLKISHNSGPTWTDNADDMIGRESPLMLMGDKRAHASPGLAVMIATFMLEHNWWTEELVQQHPEWEHNDEKLFQEARRRVIAELQYITVNEYLAASTGHPLGAYSGYDDTVDPAVSNAFDFVGMRYGHSGASSVYRRLNPDGTPHAAGPFVTRDAVFRAKWAKVGLEATLMGFVASREMAIDVAFSDDLRNFMGIGVPDLAALDIFRARETGCPRYADLRQQLGLSRPTSFNDITTNSAIVLALQTVYSSVDEVDAMVGALCEPTTHGIVGELIHAILHEQLHRTRASDRFWFENDQFTATELQQVRVPLATVVRRAFPQLADTFPTAALYVMEPTFQRNAGSASTSACEEGSCLGAVKLDDNLALSWRVQEVMNLEFTFELSGANCAAAWVGLGWGSSMQDVDMVVCQYSHSSATCTDRHSSTTAEPQLDTSRGGSNDVSGVSGACVDGVLRMTFARPLTTSDASDATVTAGVTDMIFAYGQASTLGYHGRSRVSASIDLLGGTVVVYPVASNKAIHIHALAMFVAWGVLAPIGIALMRFFRHRPWWLGAHRNFMSLVVGITLLSAVLGAMQAGETRLAHHIVGIVISCTLLIQVTMGQAVAYWHTTQVPPSSFQFLRRAHWCLGYLLILTSFVEIYLGVELLLPDLRTFAVIYLILVLGIAVGADVFRQADAHSQKAEISYPSSVVKIPAAEFQRKIAMGCKWVVLHGNVYDVADFIALHPGGSYLLARAVGMDITSYFDGTRALDHRVLVHKHSARAVKILRKLMVGEYLAGNQVPESNVLAPNPSELADAPKVTIGHVLESKASSSDFQNVLHTVPTPAHRHTEKFQSWVVMGVSNPGTERDSGPYTMLVLMPFGHANDDHLDGKIDLSLCGTTVEVQCSAEYGGISSQPLFLSHWGPANPASTQLDGSISVFVQGLQTRECFTSLADVASGDTIIVSKPQGLGMQFTPGRTTRVLAVTRDWGCVAFFDLIQHIVENAQGASVADKPGTETKVDETVDAYEEANIRAAYGRALTKVASTHEEEDKPDIELILLVSFPSVSDALCLSWLEAAAKASSGKFRLWTHLDIAGSTWVEQSGGRLVGPLRSEKLATVVSSLKSQHPDMVLTAGPSRFTETMKSRLPKAGIPPGMISSL